MEPNGGLSTTAPPPHSRGIIHSATEQLWRMWPALPPTNAFMLAHHLLEERCGHRRFFLPLSDTMFSILCLRNHNRHHLANNPRKSQCASTLLLCLLTLFTFSYVVLVSTNATCFRPQTVKKFENKVVADEVRPFL